MGFGEEEITDKQRECCAVLVMQRLLEKYSKKHSLNFDEAFAIFANSSLYSELFNYKTRLWTEGPDYLLQIFEDNINSTQEASQ